MQALGATSQGTAAFVGPSICGSCYEVPPPLQAAVAATEPAVRSTTRSATTGLDVSLGVQAQLQKAGVSVVEVDRRCTRESPELYSQRREGTTGRFAGVAWLEP